MNSDENRLQISCQSLKGVGPKLAEKLGQMGLNTALDLLFHLPFRYQDRTRLTPINQLRQGQIALVQAKVRDVDIVFRGKRMMLCQIGDEIGLLTLRFFHFSNAQRIHLDNAGWIRCFGEIRRVGVALEMMHPEYQPINPNTPPPLAERLTPVYPTTQGVSQRLLRQIIAQAIVLLKQSNTLSELLPASILKRYQFPTLIESLCFLHEPPSAVRLSALTEGQHLTQQRLAFEELLAHHLCLRELRRKMQCYHAPALSKNSLLFKQFIQLLGFQLTGAQQRVLNEIEKEMASATPMLRLLQGDVGSGKTVVAGVCALQAVANGYQVAMMAPTEILAEQLFGHFSHWFSALGFSVAWLTSQVKGKKRQATLAKIASGEADIVVGTHALFQKEVLFCKLALVIIDEQHRFGVHQRMLLREKGSDDKTRPHQLIMTATPIPRTLAMSAYADLDHSVIDELPPGRKPIVTVVIPNTRRPSVIERIAEACKAGRQVYWVCTLIEESEVLQCQAAEKTFEALQAALPQLKIALIHGRLKAAEKDALMQAFKAHQFHVLVATTVIEVGVDVANASLMVIENPERLGLSQLHQLRGRVGRGSAQSHCVLLYQTPLSRNARERLHTMRSTQNGFEIAEKDLALRGPGEVLGTRQAGDVRMRIADLIRDQHLLGAVAEVAEQLQSQHPETVVRLIQRWLGASRQYGRV
jgi:ATP-dependent DNA helicase RecG